MPYKWPHVQNWQQDVREAILGGLVVGYNFLTIALQFPYNCLTSAYMGGTDNKMI